MESRYGRTEFRVFRHAQLADMLAAGRAHEVAAAADVWRDLANLLDDVAVTLERQNTGFQGLWEGPAAAAHASMISSLVEGVRQAAWAARRTGDQVSVAAEALRRAQERMASLGPPPDPRPPDQAAVAAASTPLPYGPARGEAAVRQVAAIRTIQDFQRAQAAAAALAEAAAAILSELRDRYLGIELPPPPAVADPPTIAPDGSPVYPAVPGAAPGTRPLFTDLWSNGLAAAAGMPAAQVLQPYLPGQPGAAGPVPVDLPPPSDVDAPARSPSVSAVPSIPAGGISFAGAGLDSGLDRAVGQSSLAPTIEPAAAMGGAAAGAAGAGAAAVPPFLGGGFAPPMGGAELGGRAGAAAWLVGEVEEFGVRSPVVPQLVD
jgi:hypothetical protein